MQAKCVECQGSVINTMTLKCKSKKLFRQILKWLAGIFIWVIKMALVWTLKFDRYVLFRYFGIKTPLYKMWWRHYSKSMQKKLDKEREQSQKYK